ncbi:MAG: hypothetical protein ACKVP3_14015 [Hyphomicrobiaceae bacterium]
MTSDKLLRVLNDPDLKYTLTPQGVMTYANFMHRVGMIKTKPETWKDVLVSDIGSLPGN